MYICTFSNCSWSCAKFTNSKLKTPNYRLFWIPGFESITLKATQMNKMRRNGNKKDYHTRVKEGLGKGNIKIFKGPISFAWIQGLQIHPNYVKKQISYTYAVILVCFLLIFGGSVALDLANERLAFKQQHKLNKEKEWRWMEGNTEKHNNIVTIQEGRSRFHFISLLSLHGEGGRAKESLTFTWGEQFL